MARLIVRRPARKAVRAVRRRVSAALEVLEKRGPLEPRLHEARLDLKMARAVLKLLRPAIGKRNYRRGNAVCREAGSLLSPVRDAQALEAAWRSLGLDIPEVARKLADDARKTAETAGVRKCRDLLLVARKETKKVAPSRAGWKGVKGGLQRSYGDARRAWKRAWLRGGDADFHEWRKRAKDQRYQMDLFADGAGELTSLDAKLRELSDLLGDEHDMTVLLEKVGPMSAAARKAILSRRDELRSKALRLAGPVYPWRAGDFTRFVKRGWTAALR
jgi:CHAD domain-containing protein